MVKQIAVIGAGITGVTTAFALSKAGYEVTVFDKHPYAGMQTSYANGGQLSVSNSEVWTTWPTVKKGMKWMFKKDAPLLFNPYPSWRKVKWMAGFLYHTAAGHFADNTLKTIEMGLRARELYKNLYDIDPLSWHRYNTGIMHMYRDPKYFESARNLLPMYQAAGVNREVLSPSEMVNWDPALRTMSSECVGGILTRDDMTGDIHKFCERLSSRLQFSHGVKFEYNTSVTDLVEEGVPSGFVQLHTSKGPLVFNGVVLCGGTDSPTLASRLGESLNIYPVKGYSITVDLGGNPGGFNSWDAAPTVSLLDEQTKIVSSRLGGDRLRVAGTAELADYNLDIRADRVKPLVDWVRKNFPGVSTEKVTPWAGLRPMTPSMLPIVRQSTTSPYVFYNTGHGHLGWTLAPATAEAITSEIIKCL